jgi:DNA polymerase-1
MGLATGDEAARRPGRRTSATLGPWLEQRCAEGHHRRQAAGEGPPTRRSAPGGLAFDPILAGWLLRPSFPDKGLGDLVDRYLDEKLPEADPTQLVPETEGATPGQLVVVALRVADAIRAQMPASVARVITEIELPTLDTLADMELAGVASRTRSSRGSLRSSARAPRTSPSSPTPRSAAR